ncbi:20S proteasome subunit alpha 5 [Perkinsela sp. CCAP 1560/4]|nr:20S proteasome subunit alpha 5 [Perkinsela sp. CCAP 1560/4]KNH08932.1 20S proteasome subunit alpha 5 [Perkinsela sp. CCAP 1560/4]|eukprot:KNH04298.1 20S proteasome subunit alpha 5 [Perkinsela sp. CCAP 1560/4]
MFGRNDYDHGVNTFSPEGRLFQIEYARKAIGLGSTGLGVKTKHGIVLAAEKRISSKLIVPTSVRKIFEIDSHIATVVSGMTADANSLVEHARVEAQNHRFAYDEPARVETITLATSDLALQFGENSSRKNLMSRPYGVALLIAGVDADGPQLWSTDPSGTYWSFDAYAIGAGAQEAKNILKEKYKAENCTLDDAVRLVVGILKQVIEDAMNSENIEITTISTTDRKVKNLSKAEIQTILDEGL